ncbi:MAG TPA: hypothetical protein VGN72_22525 [Tepidisphaeraceae bacterium]|jgi:hypothetical protein|nr:hypothetical protein [Tepidisphaeraceae bacterium]
MFGRMFIAVVMMTVSPLVQANEIAFELAAHQRLDWDGKVTDAKIERNSHGETDEKPIGIEFSVIPTRPMSVATWNNAVTGGVEQRLWARIEHPIPVLRAAHVRFYDGAPDLNALAVDIVQKDEHEVEVTADKPIAIIGDGQGRVVMMTFSKIEIPQDQPDQWRLAGTMKPITLVDHIADPVADRGRAVLAKEPLKLEGSLIFGQREDMMKPTTLFSLNLAGDVNASKPDVLARDITEGRVADNGTVVDRVDMRVLRVTDASGKKLIELTQEDEIAEFNVARDGRSIVLTTTLRKDPTDDWSPRDVATLIYSIDGQQIARFWAYDDAAFMPDGNLLLTGKWSDDGLFIGNVKSGEVTRIDLRDAPKNEEERAPDWWARSPTVSPDGKRVAYVSGRGVYVVGTDGTGWAPVWTTTGDPEPQSVPVFSPDGKYIAMVVTPLNVMTGPGEVVVFDVNAHVRQHLPASKGVANSDIPLTWRP